MNRKAGESWAPVPALAEVSLVNLTLGNQGQMAVCSHRILLQAKDSWTVCSALQCEAIVMQADY